MTADHHDLAHESELMRQRLRELGLSGIIDVHTHFMPEPVLTKVWAYFDRYKSASGLDWKITYRYSESIRLEILRSFGVQHFTSLVYPHKPDMAQWLNDWSTQFASHNRDCLHSATFYPEPSATSYVHKALEEGAQVFKAHVQVGDYDPNDPLLEGVWSQLQDRQVPVIIHAGNAPATNPFLGPEHVRRLLRRFPQLVLVIAHMGMPDYADFLDLCEEFVHVYLDTTMVFTGFTETSYPFPTSQLPRLQDLRDRIVFGSDYPNIPYPYWEAIDAVTGLGFGNDWNRRVLHDNAMRLWGLGSQRSL